MQSKYFLQLSDVKTIAAAAEAEAKKINGRFLSLLLTMVAIYCGCND
jgi:hypothetical protein